jgi:hypothetical protein
MAQRDEHSAETIQTEDLKQMTMIESEIESKLATVADRVTFTNRAATAVLAYYRSRPDHALFAQRVADALGIPLQRCDEILIDSGDDTKGRFVWASFLIDDYRNQAGKPRGVEKFQAGLTSIGDLLAKAIAEQ